MLEDLVDVITLAVEVANDTCSLVIVSNGEGEVDVSSVSVDPVSQQGVSAD